MALTETTVLTIKAWDSLSKEQQKLLKQLGVEIPKALKVKGEKRPDPVPEAHRTRTATTSPDLKSYVLGIFGICKLCGTQDYTIYHMIKEDKHGDHWLRSEVTEDLQPDRIEYRRRRTCHYCRKLLRTWKRDKLIQKIIDLSDPSIIHYKVMKEKLKDETGERILLDKTNLQKPVGTSRSKRRSRLEMRGGKVGLPG